MTWHPTTLFPARWIRGSGRWWRQPWPRRRTTRRPRQVRLPPPTSLRRRRRGPLALLAVLVVGCSGPAVPATLAVGATGDVQSVVLAHLYAGALRGAGAAVRVETVADPLAQLDSGAVDVVPAFTGEV